MHCPILKSPPRSCCRTRTITIIYFVTAISHLQLRLQSLTDSQRLTHSTFIIDGTLSYKLSRTVLSSVCRAAYVNSIVKLHLLCFFTKGNHDPDNMTARIIRTSSTRTTMKRPFTDRILFYLSTVKLASGQNNSVL